MVKRPGETLQERLAGKPERAAGFPPAIDERKSGRLSVTLPVTYTILLPGELLRGTSATISVSGGGLQFQIPKMVSPQTVCQVSLTMPDRPAPLSFLGRIAWCRKDQRTDQYDVGVGLSAFDSYHEGAFAQYCQFIATQLLNKYLG